MTDKADLPYRPCVGIMLANRQGHVFVGRRIQPKEGDAWQMPQGGIDRGETAEQALMRELAEETGVAANLVDIIARSAREHLYDLPEPLIGKLWGGKYRGQAQRWFLLRFKGEDGDINIETHHPEFADWRWVQAEELVDLIVPFKRPVYREVVQEFGHLL
ncbi:MULTISPECIES: RNA pyrophosphohydrolase [Sphingobium]|uniref:RNA pyrophosphohydrolase n=1 Tax=Sphingobium lignivorans TaxID=2735886 RepID=A0ABR6NHZ1_9SPHN|nr:RNA pyrophosphohydrolase [Sphingobium sp. SYK-6]MBB5985809.1 putative (di)nucleoside polyphosphate hydrolase [Sphingobium lignivorans]BAK66439.1 RNA pyrophosphohydrolase [Sphingobium sp. SYK-6]